MVAERTVEVPFSGDLLKAYRGVRTNGHKMYVVPNYQSCYHSILVNLNEWDLTGKQAFDEWLSANAKNLKTDIRRVWRLQNNTINLKYTEMQLTVDLRTSHCDGSIVNDAIYSTERFNYDGCAS